MSNRLEMAPGQVIASGPLRMRRFDVEVFDGGRWVSLNDNLNYQVGAASFVASQQSRKNKTAASPLYDGEWVVHSTLANGAETLLVRVYGQDQSAVGLNIDDMITWFSQNYYQLRVRRDVDVEIYNCFPADYSIDRSHIMSHNVQSAVTLTVPRLPEVIREVIQ